ncbi:MAG: alpha/beta hydrolase, partial [Rickettsiales bacterium]|nr:alpha/beta hydrolase [Rickettsiales bacterium]
PGFPTIVYFHGNASHMGNRAGKYQAFADKGFGVLAVSYRGYGKSTGAPTELGLYEDARAALAYVSENLHTPLSQVLIYGESLGSGVAVQMACEHEIGALVLEAAYLSVAQRAAELYPYIPVNWLIKDGFHSIRKIGKVKAPLLLFHGELDETIPFAHGKALFEAAPSVKQSHYFPHVGHNDFDSALISEHVLGFAIAHHLIRK